MNYQPVVINLIDFSFTTIEKFNFHLIDDSRRSFSRFLYVWFKHKITNFMLETCLKCLKSKFYWISIHFHAAQRVESLQLSLSIAFSYILRGIGENKSGSEAKIMWDIVKVLHVAVMLVKFESEWLHNFENFVEHLKIIEEVYRRSNYTNILIICFYLFQLHSFKQTLSTNEWDIRVDWKLIIFTVDISFHSSHVTTVFHVFTKFIALNNSITFHAIENSFVGV